MPFKVQYPVQLHKDTKCPMCNTGINSVGGNVYVCTTGHFIEGILLITLKPKTKQPPVSVTGMEEPLTPSYDQETEESKSNGSNGRGKEEKFKMDEEERDPLPNWASPLPRRQKQ